jgi:3-keto-disaccharide hydrolase
MKRWQIATVGVALAIASAGVAGASFTGTPHADGPVVVVPSTVVVANAHWQPSGPAPARPAPLPAAPALPAATGPVLFQTDFAAADAAAWHAPLLRDSDLAPAWTVRDGVLQQSGDESLNSRNDEAYYLTGAPTWNNVTLESAIFATSGEGAGLVWNVQGDNFYRLQLFPALPNTAPKARLELVQNGQVTVLAQAAPAAYAGYAFDAWQQVRVVSAGGHQQVWVNGQALFDVSNSVLSAGQVGLYAWADSGTRFDNVRVQRAAAR